MNIYSFFKLPLFFTLIYWGMNAVISGIKLVKYNLLGYLSLSDYIIYPLISSFYLHFPLLTLILLVSSLVLFHCNISKTTPKNLLCLTIIAIVISIFNEQLLKHVVLFVAGVFFTWLPDSYYTEGMLLIGNLIIVFGRYAVVALLCYYAIWGLQKEFNQDDNLSLLDTNSSAKIHLMLFIITFMVPCSWFINRDISSINYASHYLTYVIYIISVSITVLMLYMIIRRYFNSIGTSWQISLIIKIALLSFLLSLIASLAVAFVINTIINNSRYAYYVSYDSLLGLLIFLKYASQLYLSYLIITFFCKRNFSPIAKVTT